MHSRKGTKPCQPANGKCDVIKQKGKRMENTQFGVWKRGFCQVGGIIKGPCNKKWSQGTMNGVAVRVPFTGGIAEKGKKSQGGEGWC